MFIMCSFLFKKYIFYFSAILFTLSNIAVLLLSPKIEPLNEKKTLTSQPKQLCQAAVIHLCVIYNQRKKMILSLS